ncbi:MAG: hypothetical protein H0X03_01500 [Nitrosopumilus sp.]|nr:hypothetical protein [Nitrosopumilus sp.]
MKRLLDKDTIENMFDQIRKKFTDLQKLESEVNNVQLTDIQRYIIKSRQASFEELSVIMGIIEDTVFNMAEQNERLIKLIQIQNLTKSQQQTEVDKLMADINNTRIDIDNLKNDSNKIRFDNYVKHSSETTDE